MDPNEINPPPFPKDADNPQQLYLRLCELYSWVQTHQDWANIEADRLNFPEPPFIQDFGPTPPNDCSRFMYVPVTSMSTSWKLMRIIRERFDELARNYDDTVLWNSDTCIFHRLNLVKTASIMLSVAFLDHEKRELKQAEFTKHNQQNMIDMIQKMFGSLRIIKVDDDNGHDFDSLFNPKPSDN